MTKESRYWVMLEKEKSENGREFQTVFETSILAEAKERCENFALDKKRSAIVKDTQLPIESIVFRHEIDVKQTEVVEEFLIEKIEKPKKQYKKKIQRK